MTENKQPDLYEDAPGWASLPPESRAALYPLLQKEKRTGKDIGRIFMFNAIAAFNGSRFIDEDTTQSMLDSLSEAGWRIYNKYGVAFLVLLKATDVVKLSVEKADIAYKLMTLHIENAVYENTIFPDSKWRRYDIEAIANYTSGKRNKSVGTHNAWHDAWRNARDAIVDCVIERFIFKTAGETLVVPGLEASLNKPLNMLKEITGGYRDLTDAARDGFNNMDIPDKSRWVVMDWTQPLPDPDSMAVSDKVMRAARRKLKMDTFAYDYYRLHEFFKLHIQEEDRWQNC